MTVQSPDRHDVQMEDLLYYLNLMHGRRFTGSVTVWFFDGQLTRSSFRRLRQLLRRAGVPLDGEESHEQE